MTYRWQVTKDHVSSPDSSYSRVGFVGPRDADDSIEMTTKWRTYDDDGDLIHEGVIGGDFDGFEPLDDLSGPDAGATEIRLFEDGKWSVV
jgi:hypothetical protein